MYNILISQQPDRSELVYKYICLLDTYSTTSSTPMTPSMSSLTTDKNQTRSTTAMPTTPTTNVTYTSPLPVSTSTNGTTTTPGTKLKLLLRLIIYNNVVGNFNRNLVKFLLFIDCTYPWTLAEPVSLCYAFSEEKMNWFEARQVS